MCFWFYSTFLGVNVMLNKPCDSQSFGLAGHLGVDKFNKFNVFVFVLFCGVSPQKFKSLLISELGKVFPEEMAKYKAIHGDDPPS